MSAKKVSRACFLLLLTMLFILSGCYQAPRSQVFPFAQAAAQNQAQAQPQQANTQVQGQPQQASTNQANMNGQPKVQKFRTIINVPQGAADLNKIIISKDNATGDISVSTPPGVNYTYIGHEIPQQCNSIPVQSVVNNTNTTQKSTETPKKATNKALQATKPKSDSWNSLVDYNPEIALGMRTKRHLFPPGDELVFVHGQFHTDECQRRRYHQHTVKDHYLILTGNINGTINDEFSIFDPGRHEYRDEALGQDVDVEARFFIWHQYYEPRWNTGIGRILTAPGYQHMPTTGRENQDQVVMRENSLVQVSEGWEPSVMYPTDILEEDEKIQLVEVMLETIALQHHNENYARFVKIFGQDVVMSKDFTKQFFTIDPEQGKGHPVTRPNGILESVKATDIATLKHGQDGQRFFENQVDITPNKIIVSEMQQLMIQREQFEIINTANKADFTVYDVFSSSPEILVLSEDGGQIPFPIRMKPGDSLKVQVVMIPETLDLIEAAVYVAFNPKYVFMLPVSIYVTQNMFGLKPLYYSNVNVGEEVITKIELYNPNDQNVVLQDAYSTEKFVTLTWPNNKEILTQDTYSRDYTKYLTIPPKETRCVLMAHFQTSELIDHNAMVHLKLDTGHVMRIPLYYRVYFDIVKFMPSIVDFGVVPLNFDTITLPVTLNIRNGHDIKKMYLTEVMLPLNDMRLDFVMGDWDRDKAHNTQVFNKNTKRLETHRKGVIYKEHEFFLMTIILKPFKYGMIKTSIKLTFQTEHGATHKVELPVIGFVAPIQQLIIERKGNNFYHHIDQTSQRRNSFFGFLPPEPISQVNVKTHILENKKDVTKFGQNVKLRDAKVSVPVNVFGNWRDLPTAGLEIVHWQENMDFEYFVEKRAHVNPMESKQLGQFTFNIKDLQTTNGRKYFFISGSHTLFPQYIQVSDQKLICSIQEDFKPARFSHCDEGIKFDFGQIGLYQSKEQKMNITNIGHETVILDWVNKTHDADELAISYKVSYEGYKKIYPELKPKFFDESESSEFLNRFVKDQRMGLFILPGHTVTFTLSLEGIIASLKAGKASEVMTHAVMFNFNPLAYAPLKVSYTYQVLPGGLSLTQNGVPLNEVKFNPGFVGLQQQQEINIKSDFQVAVDVLSIHTTDARIMPVIKKNLIDPLKESASFDLRFDPSQSTSQSTSQALKLDQDSDQGKQNTKTTWQELKNSKIIQQVLQTVNEDDVSLWRSYQSQSLTSPTWIEGNWIQGVIEDIHAEITIKTNIVSSIKIPVTAYVTKPRILVDRFVDFGGVQVGAYKSRSLELQNPFNETLFVNLFIGRNTIEANDEVERLNNYQRHHGQVELLEHAKGTKYERELKDQIHSRYTEAEKFDNHQKKLAQLPDIYKFCKNVQSKLAEQNSPSMQGNWPQNGATGEPMSSPSKENWIKWKENLASYSKNGKPFFDIELRNENDIEICDRVHTTMSIMPDNYFETSSWQIINTYFAKRNAENLEMESLNNLQKRKMQSKVLDGSSDMESIKDELKFMLQEQLRSMYPDSIRTSDDIDIEIAKDINKSSFQSPLMWDPVKNYEHLNYELAFPNILDYGWPKTLRRLLSPSTLVKPIYWFFGGSAEDKPDDSTSLSGSDKTILESFTNSITRVVEKLVKPKGHSTSTYVSKKYIDKKGRLKDGVNPAPAITRQWEIKSSQMHDELLKNNGTVGVQVYGQNFYINPDYQGETYKIEPGQKLLLEDAIIFEPRTLTSAQNQMQMTLYVKSEKAVLQTLPLKGWASSAVLDVTQHTKSVEFSDGTKVSTKVELAKYSQNCMQRLMQLKESEPEEFQMDGECLDADKSLELVQNQTLGKSTIPLEVLLTIASQDILPQTDELSKYGFMSWILPQNRESRGKDSDQNDITQVNQSFLWDLDVMNVGEIDFAIIGVYLEDPVTGERSCYQDGVYLIPCIDSRINALKTKTFQVQYMSDFSVSEVRKTIVFESLNLIQRFPLRIETTPEALKTATEFISNEAKLQRAIFGAIDYDLFQILCSIIFGIALWIVYSFFQMWNGEDDIQKSLNVAAKLQQFTFKSSARLKSQKALDAVQSVLASVSPAYVQNQYLRTQERFKSHSSIFLRECVNLSQRKNSITIEYQRRGLTAMSRLGGIKPSQNTRSYTSTGGSKRYNQASELTIETGIAEKEELEEAEEEGYDEQAAASAETYEKQGSSVQEADSDDAANTDELMQKQFAQQRHGQKNKSKHQQNLSKRRGGKGSTAVNSYSVDFESRLLTGNQADENAIISQGGDAVSTVSANNSKNRGKKQKGGSGAIAASGATNKQHDDSFELVGAMKEEIESGSGEEEEDERIDEDDAAQEGNNQIDDSQSSGALASFDAGVGGPRDQQHSKILRMMQQEQPSNQKQPHEPQDALLEQLLLQEQQHAQTKDADSSMPQQSYGQDHSPPSTSIGETKSSYSQAVTAAASSSKPIGAAKVVQKVAGGGKVSQNNALKLKQKAKYDQILKQTRLKKEQEAATAELAKKEREKQKALEAELEKDARQKEAEKQRLRAIEEAEKEKQRLAREEANQKEESNPEDSEKESNKDAEQHDSENSQNDQQEEVNSQLNQVRSKGRQLEQIEADSRPKDPPTLRQERVKPLSNKQKRKQKAMAEIIALQVAKQQSFEGDSSFDANQPQSQAKNLPTVRPNNEAEKSPSHTPKNNQHRRGISWGMSERLTITQDSDSHTQSEKDFDSNISATNYNSERDHQMNNPTYPRGGKKPQAGMKQETLPHQVQNQPQSSDSQKAGGVPAPAASSSKSTATAAQQQPAPYVNKRFAQQELQRQQALMQREQKQYIAKASTTQQQSNYHQLEEDASLSHTGFPVRGKVGYNSQQTQSSRLAAPSQGSKTTPYNQRGQQREISGTGVAAEVQAEVDYQESNWMASHGNIHRSGGKLGFQRQQHDDAYDSRAGNDYDSSAHLYGSKGSQGLRRGNNNPGQMNKSIDYYSPGQQASDRGRAYPIYQERVRGNPMFQQQQSIQKPVNVQQPIYGPSAGGRGGKDQRRKQHQAYQNDQRDYMYYGRGQDSQQTYGPRGRQQSDVYFAEDASYYDYGPEDDDYCDEIDFQRMSKRAGPPRRDQYADIKRQTAFDEPKGGIDDRYPKKNQFDRRANNQNYYNQSQQNQSSQMFYQKKPYSHYGPNSGSYAGDHYGDADDFENEDDYGNETPSHQQRKRFQPGSTLGSSRKDYDSRGGSDRNLYDPQHSGTNRRFADEGRYNRGEKTGNFNMSSQQQMSGNAPQRFSNQHMSKYEQQSTRSQGGGGKSSYYEQKSGGKNFGDYSGASQQSQAMDHQADIYGGYDGEGTPQKQWNQSPRMQQHSSHKKKTNYFERNYQKQSQMGRSQNQQQMTQSSYSHSGGGSLQHYSQQQQQQHQSYEQNMQASTSAGKEYEQRHEAEPNQQSTSHVGWGMPNRQSQQPSTAKAPSQLASAKQVCLDSDDDEDDLIESSAKHFLRTPNSRSRHQSPSEGDDEQNLEEEETPYEVPKPSKNFFSIFKQIQPIFSRNRDMGRDETAQDQSNADKSGSMQQASGEGGGMFSSGSLNLFGGPKFDDYFKTDRQQQSLFSNSSYFNQSAAQQDLHSFRPEQQEPEFKKQPSSLEALRMSSRPLQPEPEHDDYGHNMGFSDHAQRLFANQGNTMHSSNAQMSEQDAEDSSSLLQFKGLGAYKPSKLPTFNPNNNRKDE